MKKIFTLLLIILSGGLILYFAYKQLFGEAEGKDKDDVKKGVWTKDTCVPEAKRYFPAYSGAANQRKKMNDNLEEIGRRFFGSKDGKKEIIQGFFKGIDVFPSVSAAQHYQHYMKTWVDHELGGIEATYMKLGELKCQTEAEILTQKEIEEKIRKGLEDADIDLSDFDWSKIPNADDLRDRLDNLGNLEGGSIG